MYKKNIILILFVCLMVSFAYSQNNSTRKEKITAKYVYAPFNGYEIHLVPTGSSIENDLANFLKSEVVYQLEQISPDNPTTTFPQNVTALFRSKACDYKSVNQNVCLAVNIDLNSALPVGYYYLKIPGLRARTNNPSDFLPFEVEAQPAPTTKVSIESPIDGSRDKIRVKSDKINLPITAQPNLTVEDERYVISADNKSVIKSPDQIPAKIININGQAINEAKTDDELTLRLDKKLSEARTHNLSINGGIKDAAGNNVNEIKGKISIAGLPPDPASLNLENSFSFEGATNAKPIYEIKAKYNAQNLIPISSWYFQPKIEVGLGFGASKADNTIIIDLPFRKTIIAGERNDLKLTDSAFAKLKLTDPNVLIIPNYYGWTQTPSYKGQFYFFLGPKVEADREFKRINLLGSVRLDFRSYRFLGSISQKRQYLTGATYGVKKEIAEQVEIKNGNTFIPYAGIDFGGKAREETVEIKERNLREIIPRYKIFRSYTGFTNTLETNVFGRPVNLTVSERIYHFLTEERIGSTRDEYLGSELVKIIDIRKVKGFQHYGSISLDLFFNQVRRYSLNITYENGRKPPELNYLNKVSAGIKVRY